MLIQANTKKQGILRGLKKCLSANIGNIKGTIISSVVPKAAIITKHAIKRLLNIKPVIFELDVITTDGLTNLFSPYCKEIYRIDKYLTLKGLSILHGKI